MTIYDNPDYDGRIGALAKERQRLQAQYDAIKHSYDSCSIIDAKVALADCERRLCELRREREGAQRVETFRNSSIFFGSNH